MPGIAQALAEFIGHVGARAGRGSVGREAEAAGELQGGGLGAGGREKAGGFAGGHDQGAGEGRPQHAREVEGRGVERDGVGQIGAIIHELGEEALAVGPVETLNDALKQREGEQERKTGDAREDQGREQQRVDECGGLGGEEDAAAIHFVGEHADERGQQQAREQAKGAGEPEVKGRIGEPVDEPAERDLLHPMTGHRARLRAEEAAKVGVL